MYKKGINLPKGPVPGSVVLGDEVVEAEAVILHVGIDFVEDRHLADAQ
jgi:hypothetical protein